MVTPVDEDMTNFGQRPQKSQFGTDNKTFSSRLAFIVLEGVIQAAGGEKSPKC